MPYLDIFEMRNDLKHFDKLKDVNVFDYIIYLLIFHNIFVDMNKIK